jgi:hypothetical protein
MRHFTGYRFLRALTRIKFTSRGLRVLFATILIFFYGFYVWDNLVSGISVLVVVFLILQYRRMRISQRRVDHIRISPEKYKDTVIAGKSISKKIKIDSPINTVSKINIDFPNLTMEPCRLRNGENIVEIVYSPVLSGIKELKKIKLEFTDSYGLYRFEVTLPVDYRFTSYPRVFPAAVHSLYILSEMSTQPRGGQPTRSIGSGVEYAETREYVPGDQLRRFDWKAYAKTNIPMVKEYFSEGGGETSLIYDNTVDNPISMEELNDAFLRLVLSLTQTENQLQISILTDQGLQNYNLDRYNTLLVATQIALQGKIREFKEYYNLINPLVSRTSLTEKVLSSRIPPTKTQIDFSHSIIISSLTINTNRLMQIILELSADRTELLIPTRSWIWKKDLQESNSIYESQIKLINRIQGNGVKVFYSLKNTLNRIQAGESQLYSYDI